MLKFTRSSSLIFLLISVVYLGVWLLPFEGRHADGVTTGLTALNFNQHGYFKSYGIPQVDHLSSFENPREHLKAHHPPLFYAFNAWIGWCFGPSEKSLRVLALIFNLSSAFLFYASLKLLSQNQLAFKAFILFLLLPITLIFGTVPNLHLTLLWGPLLILWAYLRWKTGLFTFPYLGASILLACSTSWESFLMIPALAFTEIFFRGTSLKPSGQATLFWMFFLGWVTVIVWIVWNLYWGGTSALEMFIQLERYTGITSAGSQHMNQNPWPWNLPQVFSLLIFRLLVYSGGTLILAVFGFWSFFRKKAVYSSIKAQNPLWSLWLIPMILYQIFHLLLLSNWCEVHAHVAYLFAPLIAAGAVLGWEKLKEYSLGLKSFLLVALIFSSILITLASFSRTDGYKERILGLKIQKYTLKDQPCLVVGSLRFPSNLEYYSQRPLKIFSSQDPKIKPLFKTHFLLVMEETHLDLDLLESEEFKKWELLDQIQLSTTETFFLRHLVPRYLQLFPEKSKWLSPSEKSSNWFIFQRIEPSP